MRRKTDWTHLLRPRYRVLWMVEGYSVPQIRYIDHRDTAIAMGKRLSTRQIEPVRWVNVLDTGAVVASRDAIYLFEWARESQASLQDAE